MKPCELQILFPAEAGEEGMRQALDELFAAAEAAIDGGATILILSDRGFDERMAPIPALLAVSGLHHHLIRAGKRTRAGLAVESGEPREVHHFCLLLGYGANAINPYMVYESLGDLIREGMLTDLGFEEANDNYNKAVVKGIVKVMSKMGISTFKSYRGAQIFEAVGIRQEVIDRYFTWTDSRVEGIGLDVIAAEACMRHGAAYPQFESNGRSLDAGGEYQWRKGGEYHLFNPQTVHKLQKAARENDYAVFKEYSELIDDRAKNMATLRSLLEFNYAGEPLPLDEVEPVEAITRRFKSGAMSYGSISKEAHEGLAIAMNRIGGKSNTGEGGEDPERYVLDPNGDSRNSAIKQVASGRFGVTSNYLVHARELQIKMAQGAKPGEGGELPGGKVYPWIAKVRQSTPGVGLISPPPHHDIYSIEDLAELIHDLKNSNREARINVKLVSEVGVGTIAAGVAKGHADVVLISGHDGGTGASPQTSIKHAGLPWELGLADTHQTLVLNDLRSRIVVETDGQLKTGRDVAVAALLGAEEFGFATTALVAMGCIMMRVCHLDTCPVGVATQNPALREKFSGTPDHVVNFLRFVARELREIMAALGFRTVDEMVGRTDRLTQVPSDHWKARGVDLSKILHMPEAPDSVGRYCQIDQDHGLERSLDEETLLRAVRAGDRPRGEGPGRAADPEHPPGGRQHHRQRADQALRPRRTAGRYHPSEVRRLRRPELRCLRAAGHDPRAGGRRQRLLRQGAFGGEADPLPAGRVAVRAPRGDHHRQRLLLRGDRRGGLHQRHGRGAFLRAQQRRARRRRGGGGPRLRVHDRGPRRRPRADRAQLRRRHVGRHRLRARRGRGLRRPLQSRDVRPRPGLRSGGAAGGARDGRAARRVHGQPDRPPPARGLGGRRTTVRPRHAARLPAHARGAAGRPGPRTDRGRRGDGGIRGQQGGRSEGERQLTRARQGPAVERYGWRASRENFVFAPVWLETRSRSKSAKQQAAP